MVYALIGGQYEKKLSSGEKLSRTASWHGLSTLTILPYTLAAANEAVESGIMTTRHPGSFESMCSAPFAPPWGFGSSAIHLQATAPKKLQSKAGFGGSRAASEFRTQQRTARRRGPSGTGGLTVSILPANLRQLGSREGY